MEETIKTTDKSWCFDEFNKIHFGDSRLDLRFKQTAASLSEASTESIHSACKGSSEAKAAYRLFANNKVETSEILQTHTQKTLERCLEFGLIFNIQDTSYLEYGTHWALEDIGPIAGKNNEKSKGILVHSSLALSPDGVPLGLLDQISWTRTEESLTEVFHGNPESQKWQMAFEKAHKLLAPHNLKMITIGDCEADINRFIREMLDKDSGFVLRTNGHHKVSEAECTLKELSRNTQGCFVYEIEVPVKNSKKAARALGWRKARVEVSFGSVCLKYGVKNEEFFRLSAVYVMEVNPPEGIEVVEWILITDLGVKSPEQALMIIDWYKLRWQIENFHKVLKSGCGVEQCCLRKEESLEKYILLMSVIAWRLCWINYLSRHEPEVSCECMLTKTEWKALYCYTHHTRVAPEQPPTAEQAVNMIASLGGHYGRKKHKPPGVVAIWKGWRKLQPIVTSWFLFNNTATYG